MKLLQINSVINTGSTGRICEDIGLTIIKNGWESYIAYGRYGNISKSHLIKIGSFFDVRSHVFHTRFFDKHGLASKKSTYEFINKIDNIKPDIIHLHNIHGYYINFEILFNYLHNTKVPVVWTLHDCWPITGHCSHFTFVGCDKWRTECYDCPQKTEYPMSWLVDRSKKNYSQKKNAFTSLTNITLVTVSSWLKEILHDSFLQNLPIKIIHNGVDTEIFKPSEGFLFRKEYLLEKTFILLGVATNWNQRKGLNDFIELSKYLSSDYKIILVGLSKKQIDQLPENVLGIERTESVEDLVKIYSAADIVLNLSYEETFGMTTVEGLACGTPSIVYNATASPELIDVSTGLVVEPGDINELVIAIEEIKEKGKQFYTSSCMERAQRLYKKDDRYQEYIDLYDILLLENN